MDPVYYLPRTTCMNFECMSNLNMNDPLFHGRLFMFRCGKISWNRFFEHERDMCNEHTCPILAAWNDVDFYQEVTMSKIVAKKDIALVENNGRTVVYEYAEDVVVIPSRIATTDGGSTFETCDAVIADGREFLASCTALYGIFSVKAMEE